MIICPPVGAQILSLNRVSPQGQAASREYTKRDPDATSTDDGEYVMGFWIPKTKRRENPWPRKFQSGYFQWRPLEQRQQQQHSADPDQSGYHDVDKRFNPYRYVRRRTCDFTRLTPSHIVEYLKTGRICGRRVSNVRFALTGRK
ncbi:hypothetical protein LSH36_240g03003 [Paralvinella palmiformis]|uniref:Uncharacterized protein n=1 Tax=Paralvinella palmiformis TaxID=53620 RepID=A0AAD9JLJ5_9ANNE|nr:hypothetical protein LSH36_240g03003 [Paralvinella palmiformis]